MQFLKDYGELISITAIPFIIWRLGIVFQNRKSKLDAKSNLFLRMMALRKASPVPKEWADCLNQIDVVFQDVPSVRKAWRDYYDSLNSQNFQYNTVNAFLLDLLSEMANNLGYKSLRQTDIDRYYSPLGLSYEDILLKEKIRTLNRAKAYGVLFSEEEHEAHIQKLKNTYGTNLVLW